jgi:hypothetical protein
MKLQREDIHPLQDTCPYFPFQESGFGVKFSKQLSTLLSSKRIPHVHSSPHPSGGADRI